MTGSANTWPGGKRHAMHQDDHERWNSAHYPGTRQLCAKCGEATGRCEEDAMWSADGEPLCETCRVQEPPEPPKAVQGTMFEGGEP